MKRDDHLTARPLDWQDRVVIKACIFTVMAFAYFVFVHWIY